MSTLDPSIALIVRRDVAELEELRDDDDADVRSLEPSAHELLLEREALIRDAATGEVIS